MKKQTSKAREYLEEEFIRSLEQGQLPWNKGWVEMARPLNAETNRVYSGVNRFILSMVADKKGFKDNRWCTFATAKRNEWSVKKGEKGTPIEMWKVYRKDTKESIDFKEAYRLLNENPDMKDLLVPYAKNYTVFNGEQINGIPPQEAQPTVSDEYDINEYVESALTTLNGEVKFGGDHACYVPTLDEIHLPNSFQFLDDYSFNATLLHELCHSTGHPSRLNRSLNNEFGSEEYAKEELRAEISSAFLMQELGYDSEMCDEHINDHKAYIQGWISVLQKDKNELYKAIRDAEIISDYVQDAAEYSLELKRDSEGLDDAQDEKTIKLAWDMVNIMNDIDPYEVRDTEPDCMTSFRTCYDLLQEPSGWEHALNTLYDYLEEGVEEDLEKEVKEVIDKLESYGKEQLEKEQQVDDDSPSL